MHSANIATTSLAEQFWTKVKDTIKKKEVLRSCRGILSIFVEGELAHNRGLITDQCKERPLYGQRPGMDEEGFGSGQAQQVLLFGRRRRQE
jgi:hypothetical protein